MVGGGFPPVYDPFIYGGGNLMSYNPQLFVQSQPMVSPQDELQQLTYLNYLLSQQQLQQQLQEQQQLQQLLYLQQLQEASYLPTYQPQLALSGYQPHQSSLISELARQYVQSEANSSFDIQPYGQAQYYDYL
ncbi:unnamed protein product [Didymodactylos carnosus]|uniref:Uncharacterized protein n=2 Tax=Didymodactylos carnosus TaxID=1234261 RepID=A0A8S2VVC3_9BILA|nr:unnamed protein product [Didymodactylos carnosus]CAF4403650.1 unnamed protein product [Didymodactylos carnosus]